MARPQPQQAPSLFDLIFGRKSATSTGEPYRSEREPIRDIIRDRGRTTVQRTGRGRQTDAAAMRHQAATDPAFIRGGRKQAQLNAERRAPKPRPAPAARSGSGGHSWLGPAFTPSTGGRGGGRQPQARSSGHSWLGPAFKR